MIPCAAGRRTCVRHSSRHLRPPHSTPLLRSYWVIDAPGKNIELQPPYTLVLVSAQNQRLATRLESLKPQTLDVQFG